MLTRPREISAAVTLTGSERVRRCEVEFRHQDQRGEKDCQEKLFFFFLDCTLNATTSNHNPQHEAVSEFDFRLPIKA